MNGTVNMAKEKALDLSAAMRERMTEGSQSLKTYTIEQPARALIIALGLGVLIGWWIKRR